MTAIVAFRGVGKTFPGVVALDGVSFDLTPGECHALCGENGAGKSTLMKLLSGVIGDYVGEILVRGEPVRFRGTREAEAAGIAIIHRRSPATSSSWTSRPAPSPMPRLPGSTA